MSQGRFPLLGAAISVFLAPFSIFLPFFLMSMKFLASTQFPVSERVWCNRNGRNLFCSRSGSRIDVQNFEKSNDKWWPPRYSQPPISWRFRAQHREPRLQLEYPRLLARDFQPWRGCRAIPTGFRGRIPTIPSIRQCPPRPVPQLTQPQTAQFPHQTQSKSKLL